MKISSLPLALVLSILVATSSNAQTDVTGPVGRYLDSLTIIDHVNPVRTYRAQTVKVAPEYDRIYMIFGGGTLVGYRLSTFRSRLDEPKSVGAHGELFAPFDMRVSPQTDPGWVLALVDGQQFVQGFDWDDRGYIYIAASIWGLGIVDQNGSLVHQLRAATITYAPFQVLSVKVGSHYFAVVSGFNNRTSVYDVTNPGSPVLVRTLPLGIVDYAKTTGGKIALVDASAALRIYDAQSLVDGLPPSQTIAPPVGQFYVDVTSDGSRFFALATYNLATIATLSPSGGTFTLTTQPITGGGGSGSITYGAGYLGVVLSGTMSNPRGLVFRVGALQHTQLNADLGPSYHMDYANLLQMLPVSVNGQTLLLVAAHGLGDVFTLPDIMLSDIPTLSELALVSFAILLAAAAAIRIRAS